MSISLHIAMLKVKCRFNMQKFKYVDGVYTNEYSTVQAISFKE